MFLKKLVSGLLQNYVQEDVLCLSVSQICVLVQHIVTEAQQTSSSTTGTQRLSLLLECCCSEISRISAVIEYLNDKIKANG